METADLLKPRTTFYDVLESIETYLETIAAAEAALTTPLSIEECAEVQQSIATMRAHMEVLGRQLMDKADAIAGVLQRMDKEDGIISETQARLAARRKLIQDGKKWLEQYTIKCMQAHDMKQLRTATTTVRPQRNGGVLPLVIDEAALDNNWREVTAKMDYAVFCSMVDAGAAIRADDVEADRKRIRQALNAGEKVDGAHFDERGYHLRIT